MSTSNHIAGKQVQQHMDDEADFVVVGSGAAGATAARVLAEAGFDVAVLEEGPWVPTDEFVTPLQDAMNRMIRDAASLVAESKAFMPILQGRCVGGSTVVNSAIVWRMPEDVYSGWVGHGIGKQIRYEDLSSCYDQIEEEISIRPSADELQGYSNLLLEEAGKRLGLRGAPTLRYESGCQGSGLCLQGCPHGAKQSMAVTYIPRALREGARLYSDCRVERFLRDGHRVTGVRATFADPETGKGHYKLQMHARRGVLLCASAIQSPLLMLRSGIRRNGVGNHFQAHPGVPLFGLFDTPQRAWLGATQGYDADHYRVTERFKIEVLNLPAEMILTRMPGIGQRLFEYIEDFDNFAIWVTQNRMEAEGKVRWFLGQPRVFYGPTESDMLRVRKGLQVMAEMMFSVGARAVFPGVYGLPIRIEKDDLDLLDDAPLDPQAYTWLATHLFGTARMAPQPGAGPVGTDFQVFDAPGLYVLDSSVFPTNLGVNPQHTIMAMSMLCSRRLADRYS